MDMVIDFYCKAVSQDYVEMQALKSCDESSKKTKIVFHCGRSFWFGYLLFVSRTEDAKGPLRAKAKVKIYFSQTTDTVTPKNKVIVNHYFTKDRRIFVSCIKKGRPIAPCKANYLVSKNKYVRQVFSSNNVIKIFRQVRNCYVPYFRRDLTR